MLFALYQNAPHANTKRLSNHAEMTGVLNMCMKIISHYTLPPSVNDSSLLRI